MNEFMTNSGLKSSSFVNKLVIIQRFSNVNNFVKKNLKVGDLEGLAMDFAQILKQVTVGSLVNNSKELI